jgi:hypothetical protein
LFSILDLGVYLKATNSNNLINLSILIFISTVIF